MSAAGDSVRVEQRENMVVFSGFQDLEGSFSAKVGENEYRLTRMAYKPDAIQYTGSEITINTVDVQPELKMWFTSSDKGSVMLKMEVVKITE